MINEPVIEISNLTTRIGDQTIHQDLNLTVLPGEVLALVGGSGSGKTVLLHEMIALRKPTEGMIRILGKNIENISLKNLLSIQKRWGVLFQQNALFSALTVLQNVIFPMKEHAGLSDAIASEIALLKIQLVGLEAEVGSRFPSQLSGGMQKRAAFARAIALDPELIFLDEPTTGLDPNLVAEIDQLILNLQKAMGLTVVMVTHDVASIRRTADRIAFLADKKIVCVDKPEVVMRHPHPLIQAFFAEDGMK